MDERKQEIVNRFTASWNDTLKHYDDLINNYTGFDRLIPLRDYILKLQNNGEDKFFRLGTSMHVLLISRSVNFGLRADQKYIRIEALLSNDFLVKLQESEKTYRAYQITSLEDAKLVNLLKTLKQTLVS